MGLRQRLGNWIAGNRASTPAIAFEPSSGINFGPGIGNQPTHAALLRECKGIADAATRALANRISTLTPIVKVDRRENRGTLVSEIIDDHPLKVLLDRPHPSLSRKQLLRLKTQHIVTVGEAYDIKVGSGFGVPVELHPAPPGQVEPLVRRGVVEAYRVTDGGGQQFTLPADVVIRTYYPDPENIWGSEGYLGPMAVGVDSHRFAGEYLRNHYQHDATPKVVLEAGEGAVKFTKEEQERFIHRWRNRYHNISGQSQGVPAILPTFYKAVELAAQTGADITPLLEYWRDDILLAWGVPRSVLGQVLSGDRSSAETNQYVFDLHAVSPIAGLISDAWTLQLASDFDGDVYADFEEFVSEDKVHRLEQEKSDLDRKVRNINEVREARGEDPASWGEQPIGTSKDVPYDPDDARERANRPPPTMGPDSGSQEGDSEDEEPEDIDRAERDAHARIRRRFREMRRRRSSAA